MKLMTTEQLQAMLRAAPFQPFDIHLADGRALTVGHRELVLVTRGGRTVGVAVDDNAIEIVDLLLVTSLRPHSNGAPRL